MIGSTLTEEGRNKLCGLLQRNLDIFAWKPADMTGVPRHIAEHRLNVREGCSSVRQKRRGQAVDRNQAIQEEVGKLVEAGIMKEVYYHDWLSNPVMIGRNLKVYVDDLVIKSRTEDEIVRDIEETFKTLREINMKLNPKKCTFVVEEGMFLGYKVNTKGLKVCPDKIDAVLSLPSPKCLKDVQKLNEKLARLNRFLAKSAEKSLPFFKTSKKCTKKSDFHWTTEAEEAFKQMKQLIAELPMLTAPMEKEELIVYLAASKETVIAVLMTEREAKQMPIYFVSRALSGPEINYTSMEKLVLALIHTREYAIHYRPRVSVKGQTLADFVVERPEEESSDTLMEVEEELPEPWILFTDGSSCTDGFRAGLILTNPEGMEFTYALRFRFDAPNNETEYEALIAGLRIAKQIGVKNLQANVDSRLMANQVNGTYVAKEVDMIRYLEKDARSLIRACQDCQVHKPVSKNPQQNQTPITSLWSFYKWEIYIAEPFLEGPGKVKFLIVVIDYFTKWIEAKPVATITGNQIKKFAWENIVCRFGLPGEIISDNGKQFQDNPFKDWRGNKSMDRHKEQEMDGRALSRSLGTPYHDKIKQQRHPFSLTYETEAVIPSEIGMPILRTAEVDLVQNNEALEINLDLLEEKREQAAIQDTGKLGSKWEGPYEVTEALGKGAYKLRDHDGKQLPRTWNVSNLKKCYIHKM
ncbi:reverse transcriptase domain-containing protein [Tanacetum coccineum]